MSVDEIDEILNNPILLTGDKKLDFDTARKFKLIKGSNWVQIIRAWGNQKYRLIISIL